MPPVKLSTNISRIEVACNCGCGFDTMDSETLQVVQEACDHFAKVLGLTKVYLAINSGCRCPAWNVKQKGEAGSQHLKARAMDFHIIGVTIVDLYNYFTAKYSGKYGIGKYPTFVHLDTMTGPARRW